MNRIERGIQVALLLLLIFFTLFHNLALPTYRIWDETRLATNAYEMARSGDWLVTTIHYKPDLWNTKPPLMIWAQALCIKTFGMGEWAVRLPAALAAAATAILLFVVILRVTGNGWAALLAAVVLCTSQGYIGFHGARFGEYDALLAFFTTAYLLLFFFHVEAPPGRVKNALILGFFAALALAVLTKSVAGLLFGPALLLYAALRGQLLAVLRNKYAWMGFLGFAVIVSGFYMLRESAGHGYLEAVMGNELGGRFAASNEGHRAPFGYYFSSLPRWRFPFWFWLLCLSVLLLPWIDRPVWRRLSLFGLLSAAIFILVISLSKTKLAWYLLPAYPLFAISIAILFARASELFPSARRRLAGALTVGLVSLQPLLLAGRTVSDPGLGESGSPGFYNVSEYLRDAVETGKNLDDYVFLTSSPYDLHRQLYLRELKDERNMDLDWTHLSEWPEFDPGEHILLHEERVKKFLDANYKYTVLEQSDNVLLCRIVGRKLLRQ